MSSDRRDPRVLAFLEDLMQLMRRHDLHFEHEDGHGGLQVYPGAPDPDIERWVRDAADFTGGGDGVYPPL